MAKEAPVAWLADWSVGTWKPFLLQFSLVQLLLAVVVAASLWCEGGAEITLGAWHARDSGGLMRSDLAVLPGVGDFSILLLRQVPLGCPPS